MTDQYPIVEEFPPREPEPYKQPKEGTRLDGLTLVCLGLIILGAILGTEIMFEFWFGSGAL